MASNMPSETETHLKDTESDPGPTVVTPEGNHLLPLSDDEDIGEFKADSSYARKKTVAKGCLDVALLMSNSSQLKTLMLSGPDTRLYHGLLVLILASIVLQVGVGILLVVLGASEPRTRREHRRVEKMNNSSVILILIITVINLLISTLGITDPKLTT